MPLRLVMQIWGIGFALSKHNQAKTKHHQALHIFTWNPFISEIIFNQRRQNINCWKISNALFTFAPYQFDYSQLKAKFLWDVLRHQRKLSNWMHKSSFRLFSKGKLEESSAPLGIPRAQLRIPSRPTWNSE